MARAILICRNESGTREIGLGEGRTTFGRGSDADERIDDSGLSRIHASVYFEKGRLWVVDENSTNGSSVNGLPVGSSGTALGEGDRIEIGNHTKLTVRFESDEAKPAPAVQKTAAAPAKSAESVESSGFPMLIVLGALAFGLLVIGVSATVIGMRYWSDKPAEITQDLEDEDPTPTPDKGNRNGSKSPTPDGSTSPTPSGSPEDPVGNTIVETRTDGTKVELPKGRYQNMSEADKDRYIAVKAEKIAQIIGNQKAEPIPPAAVARIKADLNQYVRRLSQTKNDNCNQGTWGRSDFTSVLERATKTSPFVIRSFRAKGVEPQIGIYVAMIESEHCSCLTSPTGAKGMFQFLASTWKDYDPENNPDNRCVPEKAANAGADYLKVLITRYGTAPDSVLLAIASFNSGQGNLSRNLDQVLSNAVGQNRSFWTIMANTELLEGKSGQQFKGENIRYVPKFFATAIIGENPQDFGASVRPLSTYTQ